MSAVVDFSASQAHYVDHLVPIWHALDPDLRGVWWARDSTAARLVSFGVPRTAILPSAPTRRALTVVASGGDAIALQQRPVVLVEHGAGQAYSRDSPSYSGGSKRDNVVLFLCPNEMTARRNRDSYPGAAVEIIGSPRLDALRSGTDKGPAKMLEAVALTFHWDCNLTPESRWAQPHYLRALPELVERFDVIGHGHPRYRHVFRNLWARLGIEDVPDFADVLARARLLVADNTSAMYEWAALDRPVVVLNASWYRRDVDLWPRFWACADVGVQVDEPDQLLDAVTLALEDPSEVAKRRRAVVDDVFPLRDGRSAERSAHAIEQALRLVRSPA